MTFENLRSGLKAPRRFIPPSQEFENHSKTQTKQGYFTIFRRENMPLKLRLRIHEPGCPGSFRSRSLSGRAFADGEINFPLLTSGSITRLRARAPRSFPEQVHRSVIKRTRCGSTHRFNYSAIGVIARGPAIVQAPYPSPPVLLFEPSLCLWCRSLTRRPFDLTCFIFQRDGKRTGVSSHAVSRRNSCFVFLKKSERNSGREAHFWSIWMIGLTFFRNFFLEVRAELRMKKMSFENIIQRVRLKYGR